MASYYTILTSVGQAKVANAVALGQKVNLSTLAVGDANGVTPQPDANAKALVHERRRAPLNRVEIDKDNPNFIVCEQVLPPEVGGWEIREIGVFDDEGNLIAYGNYPPTYKPLMNEGTSRTQTVRLVMQVSDTASVTLKVDPSVVLATRQYVDDAKRENAKALKAVKDGLGAAAAMRHSDASLINLSGDKNEVADTAQLMELKKEVDAALSKLGSASEMSHSSDGVDSLLGSRSEVADTSQLVEVRNRLADLAKITKALGSASRMSKTDQVIEGLAGSGDEVATTKQLVQLRNSAVTDIRLVVLYKTVMWAAGEFGKNDGEVISYLSLNGLIDGNADYVEVSRFQFQKNGVWYTARKGGA